MWEVTGGVGDCTSGLTGSVGKYPGGSPRAPG